MENNEERLKVEKVIKLHEEELSVKKELKKWRTWVIISGLMFCAFSAHLIKDFTDLSNNMRPIIRDVLIMLYSGATALIVGPLDGKAEKRIKDIESEIQEIKNEDQKTR